MSHLPLLIPKMLVFSKFHHQYFVFSFCSLYGSCGQGCFRVHLKINKIFSIIYLYRPWYRVAKYLPFRNMQSMENWYISSTNRRLMCNVRDDFQILESTELFFWVTGYHGIWIYQNGSHLFGEKPEKSTISESWSTEDSGPDISASGCSDHRRAVLDRKVLPDEPPGRIEPWWVLFRTICWEAMITQAADHPPLVPC